MRLAAPAAKTERARRIVTIPEFGSGQEGFRFVNLRHTGATLALEAGANPILVALRLGHTSTRMVEQHYAGRLDRADKEIAGVRTVSPPRECSRARFRYLRRWPNPVPDPRIRCFSRSHSFLDVPRQFAERMRDEATTQVSVSVRTRFDSRSWRRRERYENHNAPGLGVWVYARCCGRIAEYKRGSSRRCRSLTPSASTHWAR
jgi:hypothetical protein